MFSLVTVRPTIKAATKAAPRGIRQARALRLSQEQTQREQTRVSGDPNNIEKFETPFNKVQDILDKPQNFNIEKDSQGRLIRITSKPETYTWRRDPRTGEAGTTRTFIKQELIFQDGRLVREIVRDTFESVSSGVQRQQDVYDRKTSQYQASGTRIETLREVKRKRKSASTRVSDVGTFADDRKVSTQFTSPSLVKTPTKELPTEVRVTPEGIVRIAKSATDSEATLAARLVGKGLTAEEKIKLVREGSIQKRGETVTLKQALVSERKKPKAKVEPVKSKFAEGAIPVSKGFADLFKLREQDILRILELESITKGSPFLEKVYQPFGEATITEEQLGKFGMAIVRPYGEGSFGRRMPLGKRRRTIEQRLTTATGLEEFKLAIKRQAKPEVFAKQVAFAASVGLAIGVTGFTGGAAAPFIGGALLGGFLGTKEAQLIKQKRAGARPKVIFVGTETAIQLAEAGLAARAGQLVGAGVSQTFFPEKVTITRVKKVKGKVVEVELRAQQIKKQRGLFSQEQNKKEVKFEIEKIQRLAQIKVKPFIRRVQAPKEPARLIEFVQRADIKTVYGLKESAGQRLSLPTFLQQVPAGVRTPTTKITPFRVAGDVRIAQTLGDVGKVSRGKIDVVIDPRRFDFVVKDGFGKLVSTETLISRIPRGEPVSGWVGRGIFARLPITQVFRPTAKLPGQLFALPVPIPTFETIQVPTQLVSPILLVKPVFEVPPPTLIVVPFIDTDIMRRKATGIRPDVVSLPSIEVISAQRRETVQERQPILDITPDIVAPTQRIEDIRITEPAKGQVPTQIPVIDVSPIVDITPLQIIRQREGLEIPDTITTILPPFGFGFEERIPGRKRVQGYNSFIKKKKGFTKASREPMTKAEAFNLGARITDRYTNRSFTVRKAKQKVEATGVGINLNLSRKFRRKGNVFIEKNAFAIDSMEEKLGISYKGLAAIKRRRGFFNGINAFKRR